MKLQSNRMYDVVFFSNGQAKECPLKNKPYAVCRWWMIKNKTKYVGGKLVTIDTDENKNK